MSAGIFIFGVFVFAIVAAACALIAYGIVTERRDRHRLEADQARELGSKPSRAASGPRPRTAAG